MRSGLLKKLDSSNWMTWKFQMKHLLLAKEFWGFIDGTEVIREEATAVAQAEHQKKAQKALSTLVNGYQHITALSNYLL